MFFFYFSNSVHQCSRDFLCEVLTTKSVTSKNNMTETMTRKWLPAARGIVGVSMGHCM